MYQSTDESQDEILTGKGQNPAVDPDTKDEGPISHNAPKGKEKVDRKAASQKPYLRGIPTYRSYEVRLLIMLADVSHLLGSSKRS